MAEVLAIVEPLITRRLQRRGLGQGDGEVDAPDAWADEAPVLAGLAAASVQGTVALGPRRGARLRRLGDAAEPVETPAPENISATFWLRYVTGTGQRSLVFKQEGAALSGWYKGPEFSGYQHFTGALTGERALTLRTDNGRLELTGSLEWRSDPRYVNGVSLFMRKSGAGEDSKMEFTFANPY